VSRIHGLVIRAGVELPGLPPADAAVADVELEMVDELAPPPTARPRYRSGTADDPTSRVEIADTADGHTFFRYGDGTMFDVAHRSRPATIRAVVAPGQTLEDLTAYLYGPVLGFVLRAWGRLALHASCVRAGESALLLAGDSGAGKSTTAAALASRGVRVLSDDLTALSTDAGGHPLAWPSFDHLRLWSSSERMILGESGRLERITPTWEKLRFPLAGDDFAAEPCRVGAIVLLEPRGEQRGALVRPVAPAQAVITLATLTYANYLLDTTMRATELAQLGALVRDVPVHSIRASSDPSDIGDLCEAILALATPHASAIR
jgi:hypothetical protein